MTGCQKHIVEPDVQEVYIEKIDTNQKYKITCKEEIHDIVQNINSGHRELAIFMADVMVDLVYKNNKKITILIRKDLFKIDSVTYVSSDTILNTRLIHGKIIISLLIPLLVLCSILNRNARFSVSTMCVDLLSARVAVKKVFYIQSDITRKVQLLLYLMT